MNKTLLLRLASCVTLLFFVQTMNAQLGCNVVDAGPDVSVNCDDNCTTLEASIIAIPLQETSSYTISEPSCPLPPISGGTPTNLIIDDRWSNPIALPFDFSFYQNNYNQLVVGANGQISFDITLAGGFNAWNIDPGDLIPTSDSSFPLNTIYGAFHDLDPSVTADPTQLNYFVDGVAPYRTFVMNFDNVPHFGSSCNTTFFTSQQIVLYETLNVIEVNLIDKPACTGWNDGLAVVGLMGNDLTEFAVPNGRNTGFWEATGETWRFIPDGNPTVNATFEWRDESGTVLSNDLSFEVCPNQTTTYTAALIYEEPPGTFNTATDEIIVTVDNQLTVNIGGDQELCEENSIVLTADIGNIDPTQATFLWNTGETTQSITVDQTGVYDVEVNFFQCTGTDSATITFNENPDIDLGGDFETCFEEQIVLDASPSNYDPSLATYEWSLNGTVIAGEVNPTLVVTEVGTYSVVVTVDNCTSTDSVTISPRTDLEVSLGDDLQTCPDEVQVLTATTDEPNVTYEWFLNGDLIAGETTNSIEISIPANTVGSQVYSVVITKGECTGTDEIDVTLFSGAGCIISEGISPNNDGLNDCLDLEFLANRSGAFTIEVFNRHGRSIFQQSNYTNEWCGQADNDELLPTGTYYYVLKFETPDVEYGSVKTGWIYLNRDSN